MVSDGDQLIFMLIALRDLQFYECMIKREGERSTYIYGDEQYLHGIESI